MVKAGRIKIVQKCHVLTTKWPLKMFREIPNFSIKCVCQQSSNAIFHNNEIGKSRLFKI